MRDFHGARAGRVEPPTAITAAGSPQYASQSMDPRVREVLCGLATLSDEERTVLQLVVVEGFQYAEVATKMGQTIETVVCRLGTARDRLANLGD
jgi:RNA polymerase sigma-70 factor, ECF subfamily